MNNIQNSTILNNLNDIKALETESFRKSVPVSSLSNLHNIYSWPEELIKTGSIHQSNLIPNWKLRNNINETSNNKTSSLPKEKEDRNLIQPISRRSYKINELNSFPKAEWLVKDVLLDGGIATIYGESGSTKSFLAIDLALNLASGQEWFGLEVNREVPVIYIALEGFGGVVKRIKGWCNKNEITPENIYIDKDILHLADLTSVQSFINFYKAKNFKRGLVIIDTLNMAIPDIEENSAASMSGVISKTKLIAEKLDSTMLIIHHSGKDESRGMRGSSSLKASMDTIIQVKKDSNGGCEWSLEKSKDSECGIRYAYKLEDIQIDIDGEVERTCTIEKLGEISEKRKKVNLSDNQKRVMNLLKDRLIPLTSGHESMDIVVEQCSNLWTEHQKDKRTYDMRKIISSLVNKGLVGTGSRGNFTDQIWITDKGMKL